LAKGSFNAVVLVCVEATVMLSVKRTCISFLAVVLLVSPPLVFARHPSHDLQATTETLAQLKRAVVIVTTYDDRGKPLLQGSGFFIAPDRIVTDQHVIESANLIRIRTFSGRNVTIQDVVRSDFNSDLALLRLNAPCVDATVLQIEYVAPLAGDAIIVLSNPFGSHWKITRGQVATMWDFANVGPRLQITAGLQPGSSGGPVINQQGHVVGIASMHTSSADDLDFAVPAENLKALQVLDSLARISTLRR
jgi:S1-C subfamily serine protease